MGFQGLFKVSRSCRVFWFSWGLRVVLGYRCVENAAGCFVFGGMFKF